MVILVYSDSGLTAEVVAAVDVNTTANQIYKHNFPSTTLWSKTIEVSQPSVFICARVRSNAHLSDAGRYVKIKWWCNDKTASC